MKHILTLFLIVLTIHACNNNSSQKHQVIVNNKDTIKSSISLHDTVSGQTIFTQEKIDKFSEAMIFYFKNKVGYKHNAYYTTVDTFIKEDNTSIVITIRTDVYKTNGLISFVIFTFKTVDKATNFFNDLKTQELVLGFGINKRPNHIVLDSNIVIWHQLEHSYGHRVKEISKIFNQQFNFHPHASNLDSVSGFTYCKCKNEDASLEGITGKWHAYNPIKIWEKSEGDNYEDCNKFNLDKIDFKLSKDSIFFNGYSMPIEVHSSIKLPDNKLYWKHIIADSIPNFTENAFTKDYVKRRNQLSAIPGRLTTYHIKLTNHCYINIKRLENGISYMSVDNKLFNLRK